jgi:glycosyltransferase involved in cell wall biosynthesis
VVFKSLNIILRKKILMKLISRRLRVFTWHVHGSYLYYLTHANCDFYIPYAPDRPGGYGGKAGAFPWPANLHEVPVNEVKNCQFDIILFQTRQNYETDQYEILSPAQRLLPKLYLEHDPPREHPTDTRHFVTDHSVTVVHCTRFNRLMWDSNGVPTTVIDHGVVVPKVQYKGTIPRGIVVINNISTRGRRLGYDIYEYVRHRVPLDLIGMGATKDIGGIGEVPLNDLPEFISQYRFFFTPIRYTSLGLAIIEAMMVGLPVVGLETTELATVINSGVNGFTSLDPDELVSFMQELIDSPELAQKVGRRSKETAVQRFSIQRFARDWERLFRDLCAGKRPGPSYENALVSVDEGKTA